MGKKEFSEEEKVGKEGLQERRQEVSDSGLRVGRGSP